MIVSESTASSRGAHENISDQEVMSLYVAQLRCAFSRTTYNMRYRVFQYMLRSSPEVAVGRGGLFVDNFLPVAVMPPLQLPVAVPPHGYTTLILHCH